ncbi:ATP-binding protein [Dyadobacter sp. CY343]|uniref:ATP-binding protein n=1 Tax=Dyadobacter sp. CY343 TaxID=2907299 RepID=UPI001F2B45F9|nr:ATP-binding protein [Dyadobacter sp. CY343]MCE7063583.1 ATP-binding protein [Dyadobacter sp. CY343]
MIGILKNIFKQPKNLLLLLCCLLYSGEMLAQSAAVPISSDSLINKTNSFSLQGLKWKFHPGDSPEWASAKYKDSDWAELGSVFGEDNLPKNWKGIGWFRLRLIMDSTLAGQTLAFRINHDGASEIFINGIKKGGFGQIGRSKAETIPKRAPDQLIPFEAPQSDTILIAIRYANYAPAFANFTGFQAWIGVYGMMLPVLKLSSDSQDYMLMSIAAMFAFALLHLFLFFFYPKQKANLYYALFVGFAAATQIFRYFNQVISDPYLQAYMWPAFDVSKTLTTIAAGLLLYKIAGTKLTWLRLALFLMPGIYYVIEFAFFHDSAHDDIFNLYFLAVIIDGLREIFKASRNGRKGVWLIGLGMFITALFFFFVGVDILDLFAGKLHLIDRLMAVGLLFMPLCFSIFLALDFARTNKDLSRQLAEVEALSSQKLLAEQDKRELIEQQAVTLEKTVKERTAQVQEQADKLRELDTFKSRFFINLTHEFRTPLTLILGPAERILSQTRDIETRSQLGLIARNAKRLLKMINELLDLSKLEAGKMELNKAPLEVVGFIKSITYSFETLANQKQVSIHFSAAAQKFTANTDKDKLENIFYNLISNAVKFTHSGSIFVSLIFNQRDHSNELVATVSDTGTGIAAEKLPYIFDRFYQADSSDIRPQEGTGIGLALTKELVDLLKGSIEVKSEPGKGTVVTVHIPVEMAAEQSDYESIKIVEQSLSIPVSLPDHNAFSRAPDSHLVLVIEDNADLRTFIRSSLSGNYRILEAENGEQGFNLALDTVPDLIITDLMMPVKDGYQVCADIKSNEKTSHIPVIILTAKVDMPSRLTGLQTGADAYLRKPFHEAELIAQIENLITTRQLLREKYNSNNLWLTHTAELPSIEQTFLTKIRAALETHLSDETYSAELLASDVNLSRTQLHRKLKALINQTPGDLIRTVRMEKALELLRKNAGTVAEIGYQVGYGNPSNFSTSFAQHFGYPPSEAFKKVDFSTK